MSKINLTQAIQKLEHYCAYQERCHSEVRSKLLQLEVYGNELETVMAHLIENDFLNEMRFTEAFVRGKINIKHWGIQKIRTQLIQKGISEYCISKALQRMDTVSYNENLFHELVKKNSILNEANPFIRKQKLAKYLIGKGYESALVWQTLQTYFDEK